ncbi:MAG: DMT family transporter [Thermodesulfobacteriota bacterium]
MTRGGFAAYAALCATVLFWGLSFTATKLALAHLAPLAVIFLRFALAFVLLAPVAGRAALRLPASAHAKVLGISILFPGCYFAFETFALRLTTATNASLIDAAIPMTVLGLSAVVTGTRPPLRSVLGVAASLIGVAMLVGLGGGPVNAGDAMMLGSVASASVYMVAASRFSGVTPLELTTLQMFWGAVFFLPFFAADMPDLAAVPASGLAAVACLGLFATVGAFLAYNYALSKVPAATASMFINAVPVVAVFGANLALGETVTAAQVAGGTLILASVYATAAAGRKEDTVSEGESLELGEET